MEALYPLIALGGFVYFFSEYSASYDFGLIKNGLDVPHIAAWAFRAAVSVGVILISLSVFKLNLWNGLILSVPVAFSFSALFRVSLNRKRGKVPEYISPSAWYDWQFLRDVLPYATRDIAKSVHKELYGKDKSYTDSVHRAGAKAFITEWVLTAAGCVTHVFFYIP